MVKKNLAKSKEGLGISGFTIGILSIALASSLGILLSITGFIFCMIQQKNHPMRLAKTGIILNIIGFVLSLVVVVILAFTSLANNLPLQ